MIIPWSTFYEECPLTQPIEDWFYSWREGLISRDWSWCNGDCLRNPIKWK